MTPIQRLLGTSKDRHWLADGGLETALIFLDGFDLPEFASFPLLADPEGRAAITRYFEGYLAEAAALETGFVLDTATWRASQGWAEALRMTPDEIDAANRDAVAFARDLAVGRQTPIVINGVVGPFGDAYNPDRVLDAAEAEAYHDRQVRVLKRAGVDMISAMTMSSPGEAIGIARAAVAADIPVVISFTVETDGNLISGQSLKDAIAETDDKARGAPMFYGINCAHPDHFRHVLDGDWTHRIGLIRANASRKSHAELDESTELDPGDPIELAGDYVGLDRLLPNLRIVGGCCGTDVSHIGKIGARCVHLHRAA